jgi:DNA (cytosine-5)-methyltransferase 1
MVVATSIPYLPFHVQPMTFDVAKWVARASRPRTTGRRPPLRLVDLFCGCGGMTLGVSEAARLMNRRASVVLAVDVASSPLCVYRNNFDVDERTSREESVLKLFSARVNGLRTASERRLRRELGIVDAIVAGPPCQGHSDLNNHSRRHDERNDLYLAAVRAALVLQPQVLVIENVPGVIHDRGRVVERARRALDREGGYHVTEAVVSLLAVGIPQARKRHLLVASRGGRFGFASLTASAPDRAATVGQFIGGLEDEPKRLAHAFYQPSRMTARNQARTNYLFANALHDLPDSQRPPCHRDGRHSYRSVYGRMRWNQPSQTITSGFGSMGQGRYVHPTRRRLITPHEAARIQGFPDFFSFTKATKATALREMIGNAVPPPLMVHVFSHLIRQRLV